MRGVRSDRQQGLAWRFTLVELMVAVSVMVLMMSLLAQAFTSMEGVWSMSNRRHEVYENGRILMEVLTQDLTAAVAKAHDRPGQHIRFHQPEPSGLWFVSGSETSAAAVSNLREVAYRFSGREVQRAFVDAAAGAAWNIYGARDNAADQAGYQTIVDGVLSMEFYCLDSGLNYYVPDAAAEETGLPRAVTVSAKLMDGASMKLWEQMPPGSAERQALEQRSARTFMKTIFLPANR